MASTPPKVTGSPDEEAHRRWVEERIRELQGDTATARTRVRAVEKQNSVMGTLASTNFTKMKQIEDGTYGVDASNRIMRPILDPYWGRATQNKDFSFERVDSAGEIIERSTSRNVTWDPTGALIFQPNGDEEGAQIHITSILAVPTSGKIYLEAQYATLTPFYPEIWVEWRGPDGAIIDEELLPVSNPMKVPNGTVASVPRIPGGQLLAQFYSVYLVRPAGAGIGACNEPMVFEAVGRDGLVITPGGVWVEDPNGNKTTEINPTLPILDPPTKPTLETGLGSVAIHWDGDLESGPAPVHLDHVYAEEASASGGPWVRAGQTLKNEGDIIVRPPVGEERWYRLIAVDTSGRVGIGPSASESIVTEGVDAGDIEDAIGGILDDLEERIDIVQASVDGKNSITRSTSAASGSGNTNGDRWEQWSTLGLNGRLLATWTWNGSAWIQGTLDPTYIPQIDIGAGTFGALAGDRLQANTVAASKLILSDLTNYMDNPSFDDGTLGGWTGSAASLAMWSTLTSVEPNINRYATRSATGTSYLYNNARMSVKAGQRVRIDALTYNIGGASMTIGVQWYDATGAGLSFNSYTVPTTSGWTPQTAQFNAPAGAFSCAYRIGDSGVSGSRTRITNLRLSLMNAAELVVDGTLTANMVRFDQGFADQFWANTGNFGKITVSELSPSVGSNLNITTNPSVTEQRKYYNFGPDGLAIGDPDNGTEVLIDDQGIEIRNEGTVLSEWTRDEFKVYRARFDVALVGRSLFQYDSLNTSNAKYAGTVIQPYSFQ